MENVDEILSYDKLITDASNKWNSKTIEARKKSAHKYKHIFDKLKLDENSWVGDFSSLSLPQRRILFKGELIRVYDSMTNEAKSFIMAKYKLRAFASKWFRLESCDKKNLLNHIFNEKK